LFPSIFPPLISTVNNKKYGDSDYMELYFACQWPANLHSQRSERSRSFPHKRHRPEFYTIQNPLYYRKQVSPENNLNVSLYVFCLILAYTNLSFRQTLVHNGAGNNICIFIINMLNIYNYIIVMLNVRLNPARSLPTHSDHSPAPDQVPADILFRGPSMIDLI
jgi:hypothetical protein